MSIEKDMLLTIFFFTTIWWLLGAQGENINLFQECVQNLSSLFVNNFPDYSPPFQVELTTPCYVLTKAGTTSVARQRYIAIFNPSHKFLQKRNDSLFSLNCCDMSDLANNNTQLIFIYLPISGWD